MNFPLRHWPYISAFRELRNRMGFSICSFSRRVLGPSNHDISSYLFFRETLRYIFESIRQRSLGESSGRNVGILGIGDQQLHLCIFYKLAPSCVEQLYQPYYVDKWFLSRSLSQKQPVIRWFFRCALDVVDLSAYRLRFVIGFKVRFVLGVFIYPFL